MKRPGGGLGTAQPKRSKREADEASLLESQLQEAAGAPADSQAAAKRFDDLPISEYTKEGLREAGFTRLTAVQRAALLPALCGRDLLGAAKTGSGKTLAFLIPVSPGTFMQLGRDSHIAYFGNIQGTCSQASAAGCMSS